jgi:hypothetical protein
MVSLITSADSDTLIRGLLDQLPVELEDAIMNQTGLGLEIIDRLRKKIVP